VVRDRAPVAVAGVVRSRTRCRRWVRHRTPVPPAGAPFHRTGTASGRREGGERAARGRRGRREGGERAARGWRASERWREGGERAARAARGRRASERWREGGERVASERGGGVARVAAEGQRARHQGRPARAPRTCGNNRPTRWCSVLHMRTHVASITRANIAKPGGFGLTFCSRQGMLRSKVNLILAYR
jgi:hypothetical protein